jgi:ribulose-5-phosphate 4-epimerase/fuculose-1-phosphate aldolase
VQIGGKEGINPFILSDPLVDYDTRGVAFSSLLWQLSDWDGDVVSIQKSDVMSGIPNNRNLNPNVKPSSSKIRTFQGADKPERFIRKELVSYARQLYDRKYVVGWEGAMSARVDEDKIVGTPQGSSFGNLNEDHLCELDLEGNMLTDFKPPLEHSMYVELYKKNPDCGCILHAQPTWLGLLSCRDDIDKRTPLGPLTVAESGQAFDIAYVPFYSQGPSSVAHHLKSWESSHNVYIVANNGVIVLAQRVEDAYYMLEELEHRAQMTLLAERNRTRYLNSQELFNLRRGIG